MAYRIKCNNKNEITKPQQHYQMSLRKNAEDYLQTLCEIISTVSGFSYESIHKYAEKNPYRNLYYMNEDELNLCNNKVLIRRKTKLTDRSPYIILRFNMKMFLENFIRDVVKNAKFISLVSWIRESESKSYFYLILKNDTLNKINEIENEIIRICSEKEFYNKYGGIKVERSIYWPENIENDLRNEDKYLYRGNLGVCWRIQDIYKDFVDTLPKNWLEALKEIKTPEKTDDLSIFTDLEIEKIEQYVKKLDLDFGKYSVKYKSELTTMFFATLAEIISRCIKSSTKTTEYGLNDVYAMIKNTSPVNSYAEYRFWSLFLAPNLQNQGFNIQSSKLTQILSLPPDLFYKIYGDRNYIVEKQKNDFLNELKDIELID